MCISYFFNIDPSRGIETQKVAFNYFYEYYKKRYRVVIRVIDYSKFSKNWWAQSRCFVGARFLGILRLSRFGVSKTSWIESWFYIFLELTCVLCGCRIKNHGSRKSLTGEISISIYVWSSWHLPPFLIWLEMESQGPLRPQIRFACILYKTGQRSQMKRNLLNNSRDSVRRNLAQQPPGHFPIIGCFKAYVYMESQFAFHTIEPVWEGFGV